MHPCPGASAETSKPTDTGTQGERIAVGRCGRRGPVGRNSPPPGRIAPRRTLRIQFIMPNYRRAVVPGGSYFFTVNLLDRTSRLLVEHIDSLRTAVIETRKVFPFVIDAMVVLPDHIHAVWTLPEGDADYSVRWRWIKIRFSRSMPVTEPLDTVRKRRGERGIWQRRYWEHHIRDERDMKNHIDYCWFNPVRHGHVDRVEDWPYSTFHRDNSDTPKPGDFEKALAEYARANPTVGYGERDRKR